jgi:5,10-methylene-tetrahydrofolate dehydrogenase/methenyl tetrahydrofolate cyclohydrolase
MTGWGSKIEVKMDTSEKDSKTWIQERQMSVQDKQFTKRYLKFLKEDIQKQEIEDLIYDLNNRCKYKNNLLSGNNKLSDFYVNPLFKYNGIHEGFDH